MKNEIKVLKEELERYKKVIYGSFTRNRKFKIKK